MTERSLVYMAVEELLPAPRNPKSHAEDDLAESLSEHGYTEPVMLDDRTERLVAGHGRLEAVLAAQAAGGPPPDGVIERDGRWFIPVIRGWASEDDAQATRYLLASNRLTEKGGWNDRALVEMLEELNQTDPGLVGTGYAESDLTELLAALGEVSPLPGQDAGDDSDLNAQFAVIIPCRDEAHQLELLGRFEIEGLSCRALIG